MYVMKQKKIKLDSLTVTDVTALKKKNLLNIVIVTMFTRFLTG